MKDEKQNKVLAALDLIAGRLIKMEQERESLRQEVAGIAQGQDDFEELLINKTDKRLSKYQSEQQSLRDKLTKQEENSSDIEKKLSEIENHRALISNVNQENLKSALEESLKIQRQMRQELEMNSVRQARLEEELRHSEQRQTTMMRKLESMASQYQRLSRKIERVEYTALEAQEALQNKALTLLSDPSIADQNIAYNARPGGFPRIQNLKTTEQDNQPFWEQENVRKVISASIVVAMLGFIGFGVWKTSYDSGTQLTASKTAPVILAKSEKQYEEGTLEVVTLEEEEDFSLYNDPELEKPLKKDNRLDIAMKALEKEAFEGVAEAQHDLAALYSAGQNGVPQDFDRAAYWFYRAAQQDIGNARYNLGVLYHQGMGVTQNIDQAIHWYQRAADLGHPEAQYNLGIAHIEGIGTGYDPKTAVAYFRQAAQGLVPEAAYNLGLILENGLLGDDNDEEALYWYAKAADMGNISARSALETLRETMDVSERTLQDIVEAYDIAYFEGNLDSIETAAGASIPATNIAKANKGLSAWEQLVAGVQGQLKSHQLYPGPEDGIYGPRTRDAIIAYQSMFGLDKTGEPSRTLLDHMSTNPPIIEQGSAE